jgi:hypothetical protein
VASLGYTLRCGLCVILALLRSMPGQAATPLVRVNLQFPAEAAANPSSVIIRAPGKEHAYRLSLEPDFDVRHHVISLFLVLQPLGAPPTNQNILDTTGRLHGYLFGTPSLAVRFFCRSVHQLENAGMLEGDRLKFNHHMPNVRNPPVADTQTYV